MPRFPIALVVVSLALPALASSPFGGDDSGFVPPTAAARACSGQVAKSAARLARCLVKCHARAVSAAFGGDAFDDDVCEEQCVVEYATKAVKIVARFDCPLCIDHQGLSDDVREFFDGVEADVYCAGTVPLAGPSDTDDGGFVPPSVDNLLCANRVSQSAGRLGRCVLLCHKKAADKAFAGSSFDEEGCEDHCRTAFESTSLQGVCAPCLTTFTALAPGVAAFLDAENGVIYCAGSPGAAFLE